MAKRFEIPLKSASKTSNSLIICSKSKAIPFDKTPIEFVSGEMDGNKWLTYFLPLK